jgi:hypothetical protein
MTRSATRPYESLLLVPRQFSGYKGALSSDT